MRTPPTAIMTPVLCPRLSLAVSADDAAIAAGTFAEPLGAS